MWGVFGGGGEGGTIVLDIFVPSSELIGIFFSPRAERGAVTSIYCMRTAVRSTISIWSSALTETHKHLSSMLCVGEPLLRSPCSSVRSRTKTAGRRRGGRGTMNSSASINTPRLTTKKLKSFRGMGAVQASLFEDVLPMSMQCSSTELTINSLRP